MARGGPDFGAVAPRTLTAPALDPGELAARLGSPVVHDRLGFVVGLFTPHQFGVDSITLTGATARAVLSTRFAWGGSYSMRCYTNGSGHVVSLDQGVAFLGAAGAGLEVVYHRFATLNADIDITYDLHDGTSGIHTQLLWDDSASVWRYIDSAGSLVDTPTQTPGPSDEVFTSMKLTADPATSTYLRALVNGVDLGLRGIACQSLGGTVRRARGFFTVTSDAAAESTVYFNTMIYTVNEE